jgi:hypothetical protein
MEVLKTRMGKIEAEQSNDTQREINRIFREFSAKNYEMRYQIDMGTVIAALIGAENAERVLYKSGNIKYSFLSNTPAYQ